jgi:hypothetical protein
MSRVLTLLYPVLITFLIKRAELTVKPDPQSRAVPQIQRLGSVLNVNLYFHMLYLMDGFKPEQVFSGRDQTLAIDKNPERDERYTRSEPE